MSNTTIEYNVNFGNIDYLLYLSTEEDGLVIDLEQEKECLYWKGEFSQQYITEVTNKAGSYKSFPVFSKMLISAIAKESEALSIQLLSLKDLEDMKKKTNLNLNQSNSVSDSLTVEMAKINKKYLIITYINEFEKVHYPLKMNFYETPEISMLMRTIERLRRGTTTFNSQNNQKQISISTINFKEIEELKSENLNLKNKIKLLEGQRKLGAVDNDEVIRTVSSIKDEYETYKLGAENKIKFLVKTIEDLKDFKAKQSGIACCSETQDKNIIKDLELKLERAGEIVTNERKQGMSIVEERNREIEQLQKEISFLKENEKRLKVKINQLEKELEHANKKNYYYGNNSNRNNYLSSTPKSTHSYKSSSVKSTYSSNLSKKSASQSTSSNVKKNLLPKQNPYGKYNGSYGKNYSPFNFFDKKRNSSKKSNSSVRSDHSGNYSKSSFSNKTKSIVSKKTNGTTTAKQKLPLKNVQPKVYTKKVTATCHATVRPQGNQQAIIKTSSVVDEKPMTVNTLKQEFENKPLKYEDINQRLGRIQSILNTAKI